MDVLGLLAIFGLGAFELWAAIPAGMALQLHPVTIVVTTTLGAIAGIVLVTLAGERARVWLERWLSRAAGTNGQGRVARVWTRYGVVGLGLLSPLLVGAPIGTIVGMTLGAPMGRLLFWMSLGAALCSAGLTLIGMMGLMGWQSLGQ
ncbi:MAG: small multi-drug export protein [Deltaproteobacteria bacterium]|nr:small multi-drug export protein [Deltaproteobacteria bacterium]